MRLEVYSIFDNKVDVYNQPLFAKNINELKENLIANKENLIKMGINPLDYEIYELGKYETNLGKFYMYDAPKHISSLEIFTKTEEKENGK